MGQMFALQTGFDICLKYKECCRCPTQELRGYRSLHTAGLKANVIIQLEKLVDHHHPIFLSLSLG